MKPYEVIGTYVPPRWNVRLVAHSLEKLVESAGLIPLPMGNYRLHKGPYQNTNKHSDLMRRIPKKSQEDLDWHQDGDTSNTNMDCSLVLWATRVPTEFLYHGKVYQPRAHEVVVANNLNCRHRRPPNAPRIRWLYRQRVVTPSWLR